MMVREGDYPIGSIHAYVYSARPYAVENECLCYRTMHEHIESNEAHYYISFY